MASKRMTSLHTFTPLFTPLLFGEQLDERKGQLGA